jgi:hypothetical protein
MSRLVLMLAGLCSVCGTFEARAQAETVWSGYDFSFVRASDVDGSLPENQDRITGNVWITRGNSQGIFNAREEPFYGSASPDDTEWATDINNPGAAIASTNWTSLSFDPWITAYGGPGGGNLPTRLIGRNAVVHLISDDIYLDLRFASWQAFGGGGFSYMRSLPPPTGDFDGDGDRDGVDFLAWQGGFGGSGGLAQGDANSDGTVDAADFAVWAAQFGGSGSVGTVTAAPEPMSRFSALVAGVLLMLAKRRR